jgi:predicted protein tyrosine phosphatase
MCMIVVCPLSAVGTVVETYRPAGLVTLINADMMIDTPAGLDPRRHLKLSIHDIAAPSEGLVAAGEPDVRKLIDFIDDWDRSGPLAIHCWAGISRSTAAAFVALCRLNARHDEGDLAGMLRAASPHATPNRLIVRLADDLLGRKGRMVEAVTAIGRGADAWEGRVFTLESVVGD